MSQVIAISVDVNGSGVPVNYNSGLDAYTAVIPAASQDNYNIVINYTTLSGTFVTTTSFQLIPGVGTILKIRAMSTAGTPVEGVSITAFYRNPSGGANYGRAELSITGSDGIAYLYLQQGNYNLEISKTGYSKQILSDFQVFTGVGPVDVAGGTIAEKHKVLDRFSAPLIDANVKILEIGLLPEQALVFNQKTSNSGEWETLLKSGKDYQFTFEKPGFDFVRAVVHCG